METRALLAHEFPEETHNQFYKLNGKWYKRPTQTLPTDNIQPDPPPLPAAAALPPPAPVQPDPEPKKNYQWLECHVCKNWVKIHDEEKACPQCSTRWRRACRYHTTRRSGCKHGKYCKFLHMDKVGTSYWRDPSWDPSSVVIEELVTEVPKDTIIHTSVKQSLVQVRVVLDPNMPDISRDGISIRGAFNAAIPLPHARHLTERAPCFPIQFANLKKQI